MNGYLMQEQSFVRGEDNFIESFSPENKYGTIFEDDGETAYFYAVERDAEGQGLKVLDALHIYEADEPGEVDGNRLDEAGEVDGNKADGVAGGAGKKTSKLIIVWSKDWKKCALVIDGYCHAIFDFEAQSGYNINEFPPPNSIWTKGERKMTGELIKKLF
ncbi:MAG TPA: DUF2251 domain-containing protein [Puia sp.]|nr:DUF2251 domain-containing protein [Puia sp.]